MRILVHDGVAPQRADDAVQGHVLLDGVGPQPSVGIATDQLERTDHRPVCVIVGPEVEGSQQVQHRPPVVAAIGTADRGAQRGAVGRASRLAFAHQVVERLLAHHREQHLAHGAVRLPDGGAGHLEQEALLAADALEVVQQLLLDPVLGAGADVVHGLDQQVGRGVGDGATTQMNVGGEPGMAGRLGVAAQLVGRLDGDALTACLQLLRVPVREQIDRQAELADRVEPGQLVTQAGDAGAAGAGAQMDEGRVYPSIRHGSILGVAGTHGLGRLQQGVQADAHGRRQPGMDCGSPPILVDPHCCADDACGAVGGGRLDAERTAPGFGVRGKLDGVAGPGDGMVTQPGDKRLRVGDARLTEAEQGTYLGALPSAVRSAASGSSGSAMLGSGTPRVRANSATAAPSAEEQQNDGTVQPVGPALGFDQRAVGRNQVPDACVSGRHAARPISLWCVASAGRPGQCRGTSPGACGRPRR